MKYIASLAIAISPSILFSETITVRSGEHPDFTRLVFYTTSPQTPEISIKSGIVSVSLPNKGITSLQSDSVFQFIPRDRIQGISKRNGDIEIELGCNCTIETHIVTPSIFYLDFFQSLAEKEVLTEDKNKPDVPSFPIVFDINHNQDTESPFKIREKTPSELTTSNTAAKKGENHLPVASGKINEDIILRIYDNISLGKLRPAEIQNQPIDFSEAQSTEGASGFLSYINSDIPKMSFENLSERTCEGAQHTSILDLSIQNDQQLKDIGKLRTTSLSQDFQLADSGIVALTKFYIEGALFDEARFFVKKIVDTQKRDLLQNLIDALTGNTDNLENLEDAAVCSDIAKFWLFFADPDAYTISSEDYSAAIIFFINLPEELQKVLGDEASRAFNSAGFSEGESFLKTRLEKHTTISSKKTKLEPQPVSSMIENRALSASLDEISSIIEKDPSKYTDRMELEAAVHTLGDSKEALEILKSDADNFIASKNYIAMLTRLNSINGMLDKEEFRNFIIEDIQPKFMSSISDADLLLLSELKSFEILINSFSNTASSMLKNRLISLSEEFNLMSSMAYPNPQSIPNPMQEPDNGKAEDLLTDLKLLSSNRWSEEQKLLDESAHLREEFYKSYGNDQ